jgi:hypothetical protein
VKRKILFEDWCLIRSEPYFLSVSDVDSTDNKCIIYFRKEKAARRDCIHRIQDLEDQTKDHDEDQRHGGASVHSINENRQLM